MISVIVPVYNTAPYLKHCIDSLLNQTYKDIEVFLVDDGSQDESGKICDEYAKKDSRVIVIHQINKGVSAARNAALERIKGDWVSFIDSDDWVELDAYEKLIESANKSDADLVVGNVYDVVGTQYINRKIWAELGHGEYFVYEGTEKYLYGFSYSPVLWNKIIKKELISHCFADDCTYGEDTLFLSYVIEKARRISVVNKPIYYYRSERVGNVVSATLNDKVFDLLHVYDVVSHKLRKVNANQAAAHIVYIVVFQVISKTSIDTLKENYIYLKCASKLAKKNFDILHTLEGNLRTSKFRRMLIKCSAYSPVLSVILWNVCRELKQRIKP